MEYKKLLVKKPIENSTFQYIYDNQMKLVLITFLQKITYSIVFF